MVRPTRLGGTIPSLNSGGGVGGSGPSPSGGSWNGNGINRGNDTGDAYVPGTLQVFHDGINVTNKVIETDPDTGAYELTYAPSNGSRIQHYYWRA